MTSIGEALVQQLVARGVEVIFGIPGVHTVELYRGLSGSKIRHITTRHEQGAGFMADGYARTSGKPGVAFLITGPGLTNALTPMMQARADSVPMLVVSGVNKRANLGRGLGHLHELPEQQKMAATVALTSTQLTGAADLIPALDQAYRVFAQGRGGPVHIEVPIDVMAMPFDLPNGTDFDEAPNKLDGGAIVRAAQVLKAAKSPVVLVGGGACLAEIELRRLAERLDAPVIETVNARGLMHGHALCVPASPSLEAVRDLIRAADCMLALGTELGPTDYDMYQNGGFPTLANLIRVDICPDQLARHPVDYPIAGRVEDVLPQLLTALGRAKADAEGALRAKRARLAARDEIGADMRLQLGLLECLRRAMPGAVLVGDSCQVTYAGNLYYDHDRVGGWFNAATGFGALGYAIPAAIGAALGDASAQVVCLVGDGGAQFTLPELMVAVDENLPVLFIVWNNQGYREIETSMAAAGVDIVGCDPTPPDFGYIAKACGMPFQRVEMTAEALKAALQNAQPLSGPAMIEIES
ncbi:MAG: 5-guanidino-2-oxopentanoate decarboxylase [Rhodobacterales bacterium]